MDKGLARSIGVSNFTVKKLRELLSEDIRIIPSVNQGVAVRLKRCICVFVCFICTRVITPDVNLATYQIQWQPYCC